MPKGGGGVLVRGQIALFKIAMKLYLEYLILMLTCGGEGRTLY